MSDQNEHDEHDEGDEGATEAPPATPDDETQEHEEQAHEQDAAEQEGVTEQTDAEIAEATKDLKREATAHANRIGKIMGEAAQALVPCELCLPLTPGFHWPGADAIQSEEQRVAVLAVLGAVASNEPPLREAEGVVTCDRCDGWGELTYPTRREHVQRQPCPACQGNGYTLKPEAPTNVSPITTTTGTTGTMTFATAQPCPKCGQAGMLDQPHWCAPATSASAGA